MPRAVYRIYATIEPKPATADASALLAGRVAEIGAMLSTREMETAVNRESRLAARIAIEKNAPEPGSTPPLLKDAHKVVDLRLTAGRRRFETWRFAAVHRQLGEAEQALATYVKFRLDDELRKSGHLNGARIEVVAELASARGFFGGGFSRLFFFALGALFGAGAAAAAAHLGVDLAAAVSPVLSQLAEWGVRLR